MAFTPQRMHITMGARLLPWLMLGIGILSSGCFSRRVHTQRELYQRAMNQLTQRNYQAAELNLTMVLELDEQLERAHYYRGFARFQMGDYAGAIPDLSRAIALDAETAESFYLRGMAQLRRESFLPAIKDFSQALDLEPKSDRFYQARAQAKVGLDDLRGAVADYDLAIRYSKGRNLDYFRNRADAYILLKAFPQALADLNLVVRKQPDNPQNYLARASVRLQIDDREGACLDWSRAGQMGADEAYRYIRKYCN